jgi:hypothetical protein
LHRKFEFSSYITKGDILVIQDSLYHPADVLQINVYSRAPNGNQLEIPTDSISDYYSFSRADISSSDKRGIIASTSTVGDLIILFPFAIGLALAISLA